MAAPLDKMVRSATVEPQDVPEIFLMCSRLDPPVATALIGSPGSGKTWITEECARLVSGDHTKDGKPMPLAINRPKESGEFGLSQLNMTYLECEDFVYPNIDIENKVYERLVIGSLPRTPYNLVSFEEIAKNPDIYRIAAQLVNEGRLGFDYTVPEHTYWMATSNRATDRAGSFELHTDLINRIVILEVEPTAKGFCEHHDGQLVPEIEALLKHFPELISTFVTSAKPVPFASPRSIWRLNQLMVNGFNPIKFKFAKQLLMGCVGEKFGAELRAMCRAIHKMHDIDEILSDLDAYKDRVKQVKKDTEAATKCGLIVMLAKRMKRHPEQYGNCVKFFEMIDDESAVTFTHIAYRINKNIEKETGFAKHYAKNMWAYFGN